MLKLYFLSRDGAVDVLRRLCTGEARFKELNKIVINTKTLTRRLTELMMDGLIQKAGANYKITREGFNATFKIAEFEGEAAQKWVNLEELDKIGYGWMRISLRRLTELFLKEFGDELISIVLYGSAVRGSFQLGRSDVDLLYILEDGSRNVWQREERVFKGFQSTWEYKACDYWFKMQGTYGYPEVTTAWLQKSYAKTFQPMYLDMLSHRAVLYDREGFFQRLMKRLEEALRALGTMRIEHSDGTYGWLLKPDIAPGELIEIDLG
jgi:DNA-binding HxlR family transcriptional regulator